LYPHTSYLICATPRSGSFLLCEALKSTGVVGKPGEFFDRGDMAKLAERWGVSNYKENYGDYLSKALAYGTTVNGVFGAKVMWGYFKKFIHRLRKLPEYHAVPLPELMPAVFPNLHYVWITRRDKVRQAISFTKAVQTGIWSQKPGKSSVPVKEPRFDFEEIDQTIQELEDHDAAWNQYFELCGVKPFTVVYEEFTAAYEATAIAILGYLSVPVPEGMAFAPRSMTKQADALSEEWVQRYYEVKRLQSSCTDKAPVRKQLNVK
jgi:LPS sulfotransferase NodH